MKKGLKYRLIRTASEILIVSTLATGISHLATSINFPKEIIPYTQEDVVQNIKFEKKFYSILEETNIEFSNKELEAIIKEQIDGDITKEKLAEIKELEIFNTLSNSDLSDLKYLPNLMSLHIYNNSINLENIKYNQNLMVVTFTNCTIANTQCLPNAIETIFVDDCTITDTEVIIPYYATEVYFKKSIANNIRLKNPSILETLFITSDVMLDMNNLKECSNLKKLTIYMSSNIKNAQVLKELPLLQEVHFDEYASIWLDLETLNILPMPQEDKILLGDLINKLDSLASSLITDPNMSENKKINRIILYILEKIDYDYEAVEAAELNNKDEESENIESESNELSEEDELANRVTEYNCYPITKFLEGDLGVCIDYSSVYQALCNRVGLDTYQLFNDVHVWNATKINGEYKGFDLTYLELGPIIRVENISQLVMLKNTSIESMFQKGKESMLCYYEFDLDKIIDDNHIAEYSPQEIKDYILNIGYINENSLVKIIYQNKEQIYRAKMYLNSSFILYLVTIIFESISYRRQRKLTLNKEDITT